MTAPKLSNEEICKRGEEFAKKQYETVFTGSKILNNAKNFPVFEKKELSLGKILGKGGFGTVYEVRGFDAHLTIKKRRNSKEFELNMDDPEVEGDEMESRLFISEHCLRNGGDARYAVKFLSKEVVADPPTYIQAIMDMAVETRVLSDTVHPNIVKMRAVANTSPFNPEYFIVMDRLYDTMEGRIAKWEKRIKRNTGLTGKIFDRKGEKKKDIYEEKIVAAFDLSAALDYLHKRDILYRDLKPENIGFDIRDDVKIFDFGLAKELRPENKDADGNYKLTGMTGSPRYMAPEVGFEKPYNAKVDVYSFAIMFWQMMTTKTPFELYTLKSLKAKVWAGEGKRPPVPDELVVPIKTMLRRAWAQDPKERPTMANIYQILRKECVRVRNGDASGLEHARRRSTFVFRGARSTLTTTTTTVKTESRLSKTTATLQVMDELVEEE